MSQKLETSEKKSQTFEENVTKSDKLVKKCHKKLQTSEKKS